jgi:hypothetical protein
MKKYFVGYLFVRIAKLLALAIVAIGIAYALSPRCNFDYSLTYDAM